MGFPGGSAVKPPSAMQETIYNPGNVGLNSGSGRSPGEGNGNPLQYSCLGSPMDRGAWWATVDGAMRAGHDLVTKPPSCYVLLTLAGPTG